MYGARVKIKNENQQIISLQKKHLLKADSTSAGIHHCIKPFIRLSGLEEFNFYSINLCRGESTSHLRFTSF